MVPNKKKKEQPAKNPFSKEPEHYYLGSSFDDLPISPDEAPKEKKGIFPSREDIEFEARDLSYLKKISKEKKLDLTTEHGHKLSQSLCYLGWTKDPIVLSDDPVEIPFPFVEGVRFLTALYKRQLSLMERKEDEVPKQKVYQYLNYLERHTSALLREMGEEQEMVYHIESVDLSKPSPHHRSYVRDSKKEKILEQFLLKPFYNRELTAKFGGYWYADGASKGDKQLISRLSEDLKSFLRYIKVTKEEVDKGSFKKGRPSDPYAVSIMSSVIQLFNDFKMDSSAWELSEDARYNFAGVKLEEYQSDLFKVISIIFKTAGRSRAYINNVWKSYQDNPVLPLRYPNETPNAKEM